VGALTGFAEESEESEDSENNESASVRNVRIILLEMNLFKSKKINSKIK
jgi:hypothetical protein